MVLTVLGLRVLGLLEFMGLGVKDLGTSVRERSDFLRTPCPVCTEQQGGARTAAR